MSHFLFVNPLTKKPKRIKFRIGILIIKNKVMTEHFKEREFVCKCGKCKSVPNYLKPRLRLLAQQLETIRRLSGALIINSGVRCINHNKKVGGVKNSQHILGNAVDIRAKNIDVLKLYAIIDMLREEKQIRIGYIQLYKKEKFIHIDIRGIK